MCSTGKDMASIAAKLLAGAAGKKAYEKSGLKKVVHRIPVVGDIASLFGFKNGMSFRKRSQSLGAFNVVLFGWSPVMGVLRIVGGPIRLGTCPSAE